MTRALAVDIGGTKVAVGVVDGEGRILHRSAAATPADDGDALWRVLAGLVEEALAAGRPEVCGVGCGGPMTAGGEEVSPLNIAGWRGFPLRDRLADLTGLDVFVDNDAKALALGEGWRGAAAGSAHFMAMVVSTGIGGGLVVDGRLLDGAAGNAGHVGHVIVEPDGAECGCGARGCVEAEASGTAIARRLGGPAAGAPPEERARAGRLVGRAVGSVVNLLDLPLVAVAGSVALGYGASFFGPAQEELDRLARLDFSKGARIVPAALGADGPLVGAAAVAFRARAWAGVAEPPPIA